MKRIFPLLLAFSLLVGCSPTGQNQAPEIQSGSLQDAMEPIKEANTLTLENSQLEPTPPPESARESRQASPDAQSQAQSPAPSAPEEPEASALQSQPDALRAEAPLSPEADESSQPEPDYGTPLESRTDGEPSYSAFQMTADIDGEQFEAELLRLINEYRVQKDLPRLEADETLRQAARIRAPEVLSSLSHTRPDGTPYYTALDEAGFAYASRWHGENISTMTFTRGYYDTYEAAAAMFDQLRDSAGHSSNMLSENFQLAAVGITLLDSGDHIQIGSSQLFASE